MKKLLISLSLLFTLLFLVACAKTDEPKEVSSERLKATLIIDYPEEIYEEDIVFSSGETVLDILYRYQKLSIKDGMITSLEGVSQDEAAGLYWMYTINDQLAGKGVSEQVVQAGDVIEFYLDYAGYGQPQEDDVIYPEPYQE